MTGSLLYTACTEFEKPQFLGGTHAVWTYSPKWRSVWRCAYPLRARMPGGKSWVGWRLPRRLHRSPRRWSDPNLRSLDCFGCDSSSDHAHSPGYFSHAFVPQASLEAGT